MKRNILVSLISLLFIFLTSSHLMAVENTAQCREGEKNVINYTQAVADGGNQFAVLCIRNQTDIGIYYQYKWGDDGYREIYLEAGYYRWHSWRYAHGSYSSPNFVIKFDYDLRWGMDSWKYYSLPRYQARYEECDQGAQYAFRKSDSGDFIDLWDIN